MENPRPEKVAVVDEVRQRFAESDAALLTEYRGLDVTAMGELRRALRAAGGDYKIYKNTLVRFATRDLGLEIDEMLTGPTAIAFVPRAGEGDPVMVAKALRDFARGHPALVLKGGVLGDRILTEAEARGLAEVAPREELLAKLAGLMAAPMQQFAGLLQAVPQKFAYALAALVEAGGPAGAPAGEPGAGAETSIDTTEPAGAADATPAPEPATTEGAGDDTTTPADEAGAHPDDAVAEPATARAEPATEES
ncbi:50S ribosomal protein L10 [Rhabdothermincola sediminis]|uniref:50S ribosomal protein L10 n=1 Tax=Rhabdothermincola sediminis TaxID=2751370 RepID=UPI001AA0B146|nr:50S ribosomal protein L10 [Rhabdothermincola sediminis]